ncbi:hypothetical protein [Paraburkholderia sp. C35]|uniref:hypothetical protein n=1 Tax=Paraburkholderia sp. C35 TaxID=2126993 RepID=UPI000D68BBAF|nr:hypothetical protein [Paraburkholderia sp. C35]
MIVSLVNHVADNSTTLRVWAGILAATNSTQSVLAWTLDGKAVAPTIVRPLQCWTVQGKLPFCSTVVEFNGLAAASEHVVRLSVDNAQAVVRSMRTLPQSIPQQSDDRFNLLLLSCFHGAQDRQGEAGKWISSYKPRADLVLFAGDQVYLDLPTNQNFPNNQAWLEAKFQEDYVSNWYAPGASPANGSGIPEGFPQLLSLAPVASIPDDHEYWNNAPFKSPLIQNSWTEAGRKQWSDAAEIGFSMFQQGNAGPIGQPRVIDIDPVSILLLDTRSQRLKGTGNSPDHATMLDPPGALLGDAGRDALAAWVNTLVASADTAQPRYGFLLTGQSLFADPASAFDGHIADYELANYGADYRFIVEQIERVTAAGLPLTCLTGDVHWGRILRADTWKRGTVYEVISSPTSLVRSVVVDEYKKVRSKIAGWFGPQDPWPVHPEPHDPPARFGTLGDFQPLLLSTTLDPHPSSMMRGNLALMLGIQRVGKSLKVQVDYIPLHHDAQVNAKTRWSAYFKLAAL